MSAWVRWTLAGGIGIAVLAGAAYTALVLSYWERFRDEECRVVPLMYHAVVPDGQRRARYRMRESDFAAQVEALRAAEVTTPPLDSVLAWLRHPQGACPFRKPAVILTFDLDAESHHLELAVPHLKRNGMGGIFFISLGALDYTHGISSARVRALAEEGELIGSHSEHHYDMRLEHPDSMVASLLRTRAQLGAASGQDIATVSAPGGRYNQGVVAGVARAGFSSFFTSDPCYITPASSPLTLCRIEIRGDGGMTALEAVRHPWGVAVQAGNWAIKRRVEAIVGPRFWHYLNTLRKAWDGPGY